MTEADYPFSFVAFLDILGFSAIIDSACDSGTALDIIHRLSDALQDAKHRVESGWSWEKDKLAVRMFSDCVCVSVPAQIENFDAFFQLLALVQSNFVRRRICLRGGVAIGRHFANEYLIFSEGLVAAHKVESSVAEFPRIVVPGEFWSFVTSHGYDEDIIWFKDTYIWRDPWDGQMIVDYLNFMPFTRRNEPEHNGRDLRAHKAFIEESLSALASRPRVLKKYRWMAAYHNSWCAQEYPEHPDLLIGSSPEAGT